jgi:hypothetical protein
MSAPNKANFWFLALSSSDCSACLILVLSLLYKILGTAISSIWASGWSGERIPKLIV